MGEPNACGSCNACCKFPAIGHVPGFGAKPIHQMCYLCNEGTGCTIYATRPQVCREFKCLWLESQAWPDQEFPLELRPDQCGVMIAGTTDPRILSAWVPKDDPDLWRRDDQIEQLISKLAIGVGAVSISTDDDCVKTLVTAHPGVPDAVAVRKIKMTPPDKDGIQWAIP
jgi:hypothetical protein